MKRLVTILLLLLSVTAFAQDLDGIIKNKPSKLVNDYAHVLDEAQKQALESKLVAYDDSTSTQITVVLIPTLGGKPIEEAALNIYRSWGIGNKKTNNGVLILAAIEDRQIRLEVGYGLEGAIPDITANHIIAEDIKPDFRSGDYADGLSKASESIIKAAAGEYTAPKDYHKKKRRGGGSNLVGIIVIVIIIIIFAGRGRGGGGGGGYMSRRGSSDVFTPFIIGSLLGGGGRSSGGGGWSGGGGGGFGGFGGGSSGGGGASGSW